MITPEIQTAIDSAIDSAIGNLRLEIQELNEKVSSLQTELNRFNSASDFDPEKKRTLELLFGGASDKDITAENQAVNEAGVAVYNVLKPPDYFIRIGDKNVPAYD